MSKIRVLVIDDARVMRELLSDFIREAPDLELVGTADDGQHGVEQFTRLQPQVVTCDVHMPRLDGLGALSAMLAIRPVPIIMVSSLTKLGADTTLEALDRGAVDFVAKPDGALGNAGTLREELLRKIRIASQADVAKMIEGRRRRREQRETQKLVPQRAPLPRAEEAYTAEASNDRFANRCIVIGISTGGPPALTTLFEDLAPPLPPIVIVQHMPAQFTPSFAQRLNGVGRVRVKEAAHGDVLQPGWAYVAPGGRHVEIVRQGATAKIVVNDLPAVSGHKPSVDVAMLSAAKAYGGDCLGLIMTGMGRDGADGCRAVRAAGGYVLGQDEATSDVYGMNKIAFQEGAVDRQFALHDGAATLRLQVQKLWGRSLAGAGT